MASFPDASEKRRGRSLFVLVSIGNAVGETWAFYWFGSAVEAVLLVLIIWYAWTWPRLAH